MKTVRTLAQATKQAAQSGAVLEVGGRLINSGGAKLTVIKPAPKAEPAPSAPIPAPPAPDNKTVDALAHMIALQAETQRKTLLDMLDRLQAPPAPAPVKMRPVAFAVVRDSDGAPVSLAPKYGPGSCSKPKSFEAKKGSDGFITEIIPRY